MRMAMMVAAGLVFSAPGWAQQMPGMPMGAPGPGNPMMQSMDRMNQAMAHAPMTGDTDRDFVAMMIPHHEGAIDMARLELKSGHDPALRRLARAIVAAQAHEITTMKRWQADHPTP